MVLTLVHQSHVLTYKNHGLKLKIILPSVKFQLTLLQLAVVTSLVQEKKAIYAFHSFFLYQCFFHVILKIVKLYNLYNVTPSDVANCGLCGFLDSTTSNIVRFSLRTFSDKVSKPKQGYEVRGTSLKELCRMPI